MKDLLKQLISNTNYKLQLTTDLLESSKHCEHDLRREQEMLDGFLCELHVLNCKLGMMIKDAKDCPNVLIDELVN